MIDRGVARRYGEAYLNALEASEAGATEPGLEQLETVAKVYSGSRDLQKFLGSPEIGSEEKEQLLNRLFSDGVSPQLQGLLHLLLKRDRGDHLPAIAQEAALAWEDRQGIVRGQVVTAHPISQAQTQALAKTVGELLKKKVILERSVDPKVMGGVRVIVGTSTLDGSVQTLLKEIREQLMEIKVN